MSSYTAAMIECSKHSSTCPITESRLILDLDSTVVTVLWPSGRGLRFGYNPRYRGKPGPMTRYFVWRRTPRFYGM